VGKLRGGLQALQQPQGCQLSQGHAGNEAAEDTGAADFAELGARSCLEGALSIYPSIHPSISIWVYVSIARWAGCTQVSGRCVIYCLLELHMLYVRCVVCCLWWPYTIKQHINSNEEYILVCCLWWQNHIYWFAASGIYWFAASGIYWFAASSGLTLSLHYQTAYQFQ
jgi:hypothetical protein